MFTLSEIANICQGQLRSSRPLARITGVSMDSRGVQKGELFIALKGKRVDGHDFITQATLNGAIASLVEKDIEGAQDVICVSNTLEALQKIARIHRSTFSIPMVAVTGSCGKTSTKECIGVVLSQAFRVKLGFRNWNNELGTPLNLLRITDEDQCAVFELGAGRPGDISFLSHLTQPTVGVLTGVYPAHLAGFETVDQLYKGKLELVDYINENHGMMIVNGDDEKLVLRTAEKGGKYRTFGRQSHCDYALSALPSKEGFLCFDVNGEHRFRMYGYGQFNQINALASIAVADYFNINLKELAQAWRVFPAFENRFRVGTLSDVDALIVDDSYNANPFSFEEALSSFAQLSHGKRKIVVLGEMLELGAGSKEHHEQLGELLADVGVSIVIGVGVNVFHTIDRFRKLSENGIALHCENLEEAVEIVLQFLTDKDSLLIKGSHGTGLHRLRSILEEKRTLTVPVK
jgi:UDP-N-acetylmuramoyl-tripeptide--D-alanyl-D-alanine ligase